MYLQGNLKEDYRALRSQREIWNLVIIIENKADADLPSFFPELSWNPNDIGPGSRMELLGDENGELLVAEMRANSSYQTKQADAFFYEPDNDMAMIYYSELYSLLLPGIWMRIWMGVVIRIIPPRTNIRHRDMFLPLVIVTIRIRIGIRVIRSSATERIMIVTAYFQKMNGIKTAMGLLYGGLQ